MPDVDSEVLLEQSSPNGNLVAIVEDNVSSVYFYLYASPDAAFRMRSCWVRNLRPAPSELDRESMAVNGSAPLLPAAYCSHPQGASRLDPSRLSVVWFEEGDAAALLENNEILAIIPSWSGLNGFNGYARDCAAESPLAWPLGKRETNVLFARVERARENWNSWNQNPWPAYSKAQIAAYQGEFGAYSKYFGIDGGIWPPKALIRFDQPDAIIFATVGVSLRPMPGVEMSYTDPSPMRRIELCLAIDPRLADESARRQIAQYISGQSSLPWRRYTFYDDGHTLPCDSIPAGRSGNLFTAMLFRRDPNNAPSVSLPHHRGDRVTTLWMIPITQRELSLAKELGSKVLAERLALAGHGQVHRDRPEVR